MKDFDVWWNKRFGPEENHKNDTWSYGGLKGIAKEAWREALTHKETNTSWGSSPDRMGGQFTDEEISRSKGEQW